MKLIGYLPTWAGPPGQVQYSELTHICYAFATPADDRGGLFLSGTSAAKLRDVVTRAHAAGTKVLISVWGGLSAADLQKVRTAASTGTGRVTIARNVAELVELFDLDGADIDWEYPTGQAADFTALMRTLRSVLPADKLLTAAVIAGANFAAGLAVQPAVFDLVDWLGIMTYDDNLPGQPHASYDFMVHYCTQWRTRGLPADKLVAGIPFYARPGGKPYSYFVGLDRANADRDVVNGQGYNGRPTVRRKVEWAKANAAGVMYWELSQDMHDNTSLVTTAHKAAGVPTGADWFTDCFA